MPNPRNRGDRIVLDEPSSFTTSLNPAATWPEPATAESLQRVLDELRRQEMLTVTVPPSTFWGEWVVTPPPAEPQAPPPVSPTVDLNPANPDAFTVIAPLQALIAADDAAGLPWPRVYAKLDPYGFMGERPTRGETSTPTLFMVSSRRAVSLYNTAYHTVGREVTPYDPGNNPRGGRRTYSTPDLQWQCALRVHVYHHHRPALRTSFIAAMRYLVYPRGYIQLALAFPRSRSYREQAACVALGVTMRETIAALRAGGDITDHASRDNDPHSPLLNALTELLHCRHSLPMGEISDALEEAGASERVVRFECGHIGLEGEGHSTRDGDVCSECREEYYVETNRGRIVHRDSAYYWDSDDEWHEDEEPSDEDDEDDGDDDGDDGYNGDPDRIMDYSTNVLRVLSVDPSFVSTSVGDFHMGVELETIYTGDSSGHSKVYDVRRELGTDYLVGKYDGSLNDTRIAGQGIEWVTRPTSLKVHLEKLSRWTDSAKNLVAWDARCCGMHVHIDSRAFTALSLGKMLQFYNKRENVDFIRLIAGRHPDKDSQAESYAARDIHPDHATCPLKALKGKSTNRYTMVNLTNLNPAESRRLHLEYMNYGSSNTVEVRIFRASMRKERLLAQLEFTHALVNFCRVAGFNSLDSVDFTKWLTPRTKLYPHLARFLDVRPNRHGSPRGASTTHTVPARADETTDLVDA